MPAPRSVEIQQPHRHRVLRLLQDGVEVRNSEHIDLAEERGFSKCCGREQCAEDENDRTFHCPKRNEFGDKGEFKCVLEGFVCGVNRGKF